MAGERRRRRRRVIECAAWRRKKGDREEEWGGGGVGCLVFKNKETRGGEREEQTGRGEGSGVEVRGGWLAGAVAGLCLWREGAERG